MKKIVFICTGNTCRSPMAEGLAYKAFSEAEIPIQVLSRGILVTFPAPANPHSVAMVEQEYPQVLSHMATAFCRDEVDRDTLILTMTSRHKDYILMQYPELANQVETYSAYVGDQGEVEDPYGGSLGLYKACANQLRDLTERLIEKIQTENNWRK